MLVHVVEVEVRKLKIEEDMIIKEMIVHHRLITENDVMIEEERKENHQEEGVHLVQKVQLLKVKNCLRKLKCFVFMMQK